MCVRSIRFQLKFRVIYHFFFFFLDSYRYCVLIVGYIVNLHYLVDVSRHYRHFNTIKYRRDICYYYYLKRIVIRAFWIVIRRSRYLLSRPKHVRQLVLYTINPKITWSDPIFIAHTYFDNCVVILNFLCWTVDTPTDYVSDDVITNPSIRLVVNHRPRPSQNLRCRHLIYIRWINFNSEFCNGFRRVHQSVIFVSRRCPMRSILY